jgi:hypothetical protein
MWSLSVTWLSRILVALLLVIGAAESISVLSIKGTKFYNAQGQQVFFKGWPNLSNWLN